MMHLHASLLTLGSWNPIANALTSALRGTFESMNNDLARDLWSEFSMLLFDPVPVFQDSIVQTLEHVSVLVAMPLLFFMSVYQIIRRLADKAAGREIESADNMARRMMIATATCTGLGWFLWFVADLRALLLELVNSFPTSVNVLSLYWDPATGNGTLSWALFLLIFLGATLCLIAQRFIFQAEFSLLCIIGPFMALTRLGDDNPVAWQIWKREVIAIMLTTLLQLLILRLFTEKLMGMNPDALKVWAGTLQRWFSAGGMIYCLWNTPRWARQFTYSTGTSHALVGAGMEVSRMAAIRMMMKVAATSA